MGDYNSHDDDDDDDHDETMLIKSGIAIIPYRVITTTILSLVLPLAFLALARIACGRFLLSPLAPSSPVFSSVFLHSINHAILYLMVSTISIAALVHTLTNKLMITWSPLTTLGSRPYAAWILLWTLLVSVGFKFNRAVAMGTGSSSFGTGMTLFSRMIFVLGLHETMIYWSRLVVEPVVNDTIFSVVSRNERWVQRGIMGGSFGCLLYWKLRKEVEPSLVVVGLAKVEMWKIDLEIADFAGLCLYYTTVMIGVVKVSKGIAWLAMSLFCRIVDIGILSDDEPCNLDIEETV
ncbi:Transmembrane protein [Trema orientale]|uniref:Transmembrane protein n=1 Tax=Trema orientale TaxID=63057 RepID=A0A2P5DGK1_TREOI|nr:Transmembrane protein [Trema orientale]